MSGRTLLVLTTVHQPDDARIRSKLIPALASAWDVTYACREPGPSDRSDLTWVPLRGGRVIRWLRAWATALSGRWDLVALHDPELLPIGVVRGLLGRPTLFDVHENVPDQIRHKPWLPAPMQRPMAGLARAGLRLAERLMAISLAEAGYAHLFTREHPVIANHLRETALPDPTDDGGYLVYLGDVTEQRGAFTALEAAAGAEAPLRLVGRVAPPDLVDRLRERAAALGVEADVLGPMPHEQALEVAASASAGLSPLSDVPNYRHSLPTKVPEYLALGLPVLVSDLPGTVEPLGGLDAVIALDPDDPAAWRAAGRRVVSDPSLRTAAAAQIPEVRHRFSWDDALVLRVYEQAAAR